MSRPPPPPPPPPPNRSQPKSGLLVNSTISQDRTLGATAMEESNLQSLNRPLIALSLKSDSTFVPSNPVSSPYPLPPAGASMRKISTAHRRRRSSSRSSYGSRSTSSSDSSRRGPTTGSVINAKKRLRNELEDEARLGSAPPLFLEAPNDGIQPLEGSNMGKSYLHIAALNNRMGRPLTAREQDLLQKLQLDVDSENGNSSSSSDSEDFSDPDDSEGSEPDLPVHPNITKDTCLTETEEPSVEKVTALWNDARRYRIICAIECSSTHPSNHHFALFYEDVPFKSKESGIVSRHLSGHIPIPSLKRYLETVEKCGFIVYRHYMCEKSGQDAPRNRPTVLPKVIPMSNKLDYREFIGITSQRLDRAIRNLASCDPNDCLCPTFLQDRSYLELMGAPYRFIYHHRTELLNYIKSAKRSTQHKALALLNYVDATVGAKHKRADDLFRRGITNFQSLNFLFKPNDILVVTDQGRHTGHALRAWLDSLHSPHWDCWSWTYDGSSFTRKDATVQGPDLKDVRDKQVSIQELATYPIKYAPGDVRESLKQRGQMFWKLRSQSYISYTGWDVLKDENHVATRCVIDYQTYRRFHPGASISPLTRAPRPNLRWSRNILSPNSTPSDEDLYLMPPTVHGFVLREKKWVNLWVENVSEVSWNKEAFERLVLPPKTKDLVKALVMVRASKQVGEGKRQLTNLPAKRDDIITSKGNGLIVLLHGGPGTGKTLTAESVAELAEMPLYRVTCGDIGTNAEAVEKYLQTILYLGKTWNCVLLLDEADVFLEERTLSDLERNSLVSGKSHLTTFTAVSLIGLVFLRILEYYEGILILTSNRVGTFDEAFRSRMQLALHYPNLTPVSRKKIWQNFFDMLQEDGDDVDVDEIKLHIDELADMEMNGREIRNSLITAKQLALYKKETLTWDHVEHTVRTAGDFNKYLKNVHGHTDEQRAREEGLR